MSEPRPESPDSRALRVRFLRLAGVNVLSNLTIPAASLIDTAMLGRLDEVRFLAGVALASVIFDYLYWGFGFLRMGTTGLVALAWAANDRSETARILLRAMAVAVAFGLGVVATAPWLKGFAFAMLSGPDTSEAVGRVYFDARIFGAPAVFLNLTIAGFFIGTGRVKSALVTAAVQNVGNALLNIWFIAGLGWAAAGAGYASMASQYIALVVGGILISRRELELRQPWSAVLDRSAIRELFSLNRDLFIRTLSMVTVFGVFTNLSGQGGENRLAGFAILLRLLTVAAYVIDGAAYALETLAGTLWNQRRIDELQALTRFAMFGSLGLAVGLATTLELFGPQLYAIINRHEPVVAIALRYQGWMLLALFFGVVAWIYDGVFIGLTWGRRLRYAALWSASAFVPGAWLAWQLRSGTWLWIAFVMFTAARALTLSWSWAHATRSAQTASKPAASKPTASNDLDRRME
ncbi:MAG: MATE family efflux transporter [Myxococcota bacterium]